MTMIETKLEIPRHALNHILSKINLPLHQNTGAYILFHFRSNQEELIIYDNTKNKPYKGIYRGDTYLTLLKSYITSSNSVESGTVATKIPLPHIGSDEVGFGDFFGPLVVVSAYVDDTIAGKLAPYDIQDSKKMDDQKIRMIGAALINLVPHAKNIVLNPKYNELINAGYNMNKMKAMLHQNVLLNLARKQNYSGVLYLDKFTSDRLYQTYIKGMDQGHVVLLADGERNSFAIATASVLARYYFLLEMAALNNRFQTTIPLGAGAIVDQFARDFLKKNGPSNLRAITKHNFRNFKDLFPDA